MSSDEEEAAATGPVLHKDSDRGSSVSSELQVRKTRPSPAMSSHKRVIPVHLTHVLCMGTSQEEYEELLRFAVVTPKFEGPTAAQLQSWLSTSREAARPSRGMDDVKSQRQAGDLS